MYVVIRQYQVEPNAVEVVTQHVQDGFAPFVRDILPGFVEYYWIDAGDGHFISVSVFEDQVVGDISTRLAVVHAQEHLAAAVPQPPVVIEGKVIVRVVGQTGQAAG